MGTKTKRNAPATPKTTKGTPASSSAAAETVLTAQGGSPVLTALAPLLAFQTVRQFLEATEPYVVAGLEDPLTALVPDDRKARKLSGEMGLPYVVLPPDDVMKAEGITGAGAFAPAVLERVFPIHP